MVFQKNYIESLVGTAKPDTPQFLLKNPQKKQLWVNSIELTPDSFFAKKGKIVIKINGDFILPESEVGAFQSYKLFHVPLDKQELFKQKKIEIFVWNGIDSDEVQISVNVLISEEFSNISLAGIPTDSETLNRDVSDDYVDNSTLFLSDILSLKLDDVKSSVDSENVDLQAKIQSLINSLPDSPANDDIKAKLDSIKSSVDTTDSDITTKLQAVINALPDSPANEDIITKLQTIVNSVDNVTNSFNSDTIPHIILQIEGFEADTAYATIHNSLTQIKNALVGLRDGFDIDELADTITTLNSNRATIRNFDSDFGEVIDNLYLFLVRAAISPELKKSTTGALFENRIYRDETIHNLLNMKGNKHLILTLSGSNVNPPSALTETFTPTLPASIAYILRGTYDATATYQSSVGHSNFVRSNNYRPVNKTALRRQYIRINPIRTLRDVVRSNAMALSTQTLVNYNDKIIVIDGLTSSLKVVTFSYDVHSLLGSFEHLLSLLLANSIVRTSTRTKTGSTSAGGWRLDYTFSPWSAYTSVTSGINELVKLALHYNIEYHIEGSDTLNFAVVENLGILPDSSGEKTVTTTRRYIRIRRRIVPTALAYQSLGYVKPTNYIGYDVNANPIGVALRFNFDFKHDFAYDSLPALNSSPLNYEVHSDPITLDNLIDSQTQGGTSYLSFEIKDSFGLWHEYISANTIGSITQGSRKTIPFGEAVSNILLPSSQNSFRASLKTVGSLKTGVSVIRVA